MKVVCRIEMYCLVNKIVLMTLVEENGKVTISNDIQMYLKEVWKSRCLF